MLGSGCVPFFDCGVDHETLVCGTNCPSKFWRCLLRCFKAFVNAVFVISCWEFVLSAYHFHVPNMCVVRFVLVCACMTLWYSCVSFVCLLYVFWVQSAGVIEMTQIFVIR